MEYFLQDVANYLYRKNQGDFRNTLLVFPNRRARLFFNHFLSKQTNVPLWAPQFFTINDFVQKLSGLQVADPLTLLFKLFQVFREITHSTEPFDSFYFYCEMILADFDDIDKYQVPADKLFKNLKDIKNLDDMTGVLSDEQLQLLRNFWDLVNRSANSHEKQDFITLWDALHKIYLRFNEVLDSESIGYEGKAYRQGINRLHSDSLPDVFTKQLVFAGFNALNYSEELLFDQFLKQGNALFFWDFAENYLHNEKHEAGFFLRKYVQRYPQPADFTATPCPPPPGQHIHTLSVPAALAQAKAINHSLQILGAETIASPLQTALVLADENLLLPVVNSLPDQAARINISMGYPLIDSPLYSLISALTDLQANRRKPSESGSSYWYYHRDFINVFQHELVHTVAQSTDFSEFLQQCRLTNRIYIDPESVPGAHPLLQAVLQSVDSPKHFGSYLRRIVELLAQNLPHAQEATPKNQWDAELLFQTHKVLLRFEALMEETPISMSFPTVLQLFRKILQGISVPFSGEPLEGLQVMGVLETRTLDFENLIILSMNEGNFPKSSGAPSLIPYALREGFKLPTQKHQDAIFSYYFYRLLHRSRNIVLVYHTKTEGLQKGEPSRYLQQLRFTQTTPITHHNLGYRIEPLSVNSCKAEKSTGQLALLNEYLRPCGTKTLSPSALICYLQCPLKFYFRYIQKMREPEQISEEVEANVFGSILHKAASLLYKDYIDQPLDTSRLSALLNDSERITRAIDTAFAEDYFHQEAGSVLNFKGRDLIVRSVIERYIKGLIRYDSRNTPFTLRALEKLFSRTLLLPSGKQVSIGGYIDRLDEKDGNLRVIDYKTGTKKASFEGIQDLFAPEKTHKTDAVFQSLMYCWILDQPEYRHNLLPQLFFLRGIENPDFAPGISHSKTPVRSYADYAPVFQEKLIQLLEELFNEKIPFEQTGNEKNCQYCPYSTICLRKNRP